MQILTITLLDQHRIRIWLCTALIARFENIFQPIERHLYNIRVHHRQQFAHRWNAACIHEISDLFSCSATRRVRHSPGCLFPCLILGRAQDIYEHRKYVRLDDCLNLLRVARRNIRDRPAGFFDDGVLVCVQQLKQSGKRGAVKYDLSLSVVAGDDIADSAEGR